MRKDTPVHRLLLIILGLSLGLSVQARHIAGGEMSYTYLGPGNDGKLKYLITLRLYRDCQSTGAQLDEVAYISIFDRPSGATVLSLQVARNRVETLQLSTPGPCIDNAPIVCYQVGIYMKEVQLAPSKMGYDISYQRCCRIEDISNIVASERTGATYTATIPGTDDELSAPQNSSPRYNTSDTVIICENNYFVYDFSAFDDDGDNLTYEFDQPFDGAGTQQPQPTQPLPPPYDGLPYSFGYNFFKPMGDQVFINPQTGMISGIAPAAGIYVVTVTVTERRNGKIINGHRKDLHIKVAPCTIAAATLRPSYITCDGFTMTFQNLSSSPLIKTFDWDFGVNGATSTEERPTFTYPDTGVYKLRLITNKNQDCSDTAYSVVKVFPVSFLTMMCRTDARTWR